MLGEKFDVKGYVREKEIVAETFLEMVRFLKELCSTAVKVVRPILLYCSWMIVVSSTAEC